MNVNATLHIISGLCAIILSACVSTQTVKKGEQKEGFVYELDQPKVIPVEAYQADQELLARNELIYKLLVSEIAGQRGKLAVSVDNMLEAAKVLDNPRIAERVSRIAIYAKDYENALAAINRWIELEPDRSEAHQLAVVISLRLNNESAVMKHLEEVLLRAGDNRSTILTGLLAREQNHDKAMNLMGQLVEKYDQDPQAVFAYGNLAMSFKRYEDAERLMTSALELKPDMFNAIITRAQAMRSQGKLEESITSLKTAIQQYPDASEVGLAYGRLLISLKRYEEATTQFHKLLENDKENVQIVYALALLTLDLNRLAEAKTYFLRLLELGYRDQESHYYLGRIAESQQRYNDALKRYKKITQGNYHLDAQLRTAQMLGKLGKLYDAQEHLNTLRTLNAEPALVVRIILVESELLREAKLYHQSLDILGDGLQKIPGNKELLYARALIAEKLDKLDLLERDLRLILESEPDNADALNALGYTLADKTDRLDEAYELINQAVKLKPNNAAVIDSLGWILYRMGKHDEAIVYLREALSLQYDPEIAAHLGEVLWVTGDQKGAKQVWQRALKEIPNHEVILEIIRRFEK